MLSSDTFCGRLCPSVDGIDDLCNLQATFHIGVIPITVMQASHPVLQRSATPVIGWYGQWLATGTLALLDGKVIERAIHILHDG